MAAFLGDTGDPTMNNYGVYNSDVLVEGSANSVPTVTYEPASASGSVWDDLRNILGTIGTTAKEVGRAVGQAEETIHGVDDAFKAGRNQGQQEAKALNWWQRRTEFEKFGVVIGVAGIGVAIYSMAKGQ